MADILKVDVRTSNVNLRLTEMPEEVRNALVETVTAEATELKAAIQAAAADRLQVRTGKFVKRIRSGVRRSKKAVKGRVYSTDPRAHLFEYGGRTQPHEIVASKAQALILRGRAGMVFAARVQHPGGHYDARRIFRDPFAEMQPKIVDGMKAAVDGPVERFAE